MYQIKPLAIISMQNQQPREERSTTAQNWCQRCQLTSRQVQRPRAHERTDEGLVRHNSRRNRPENRRAARTASHSNANNSRGLRMRYQSIWVDKPQRLGGTVLDQRAYDSKLDSSRPIGNDGRDQASLLRDDRRIR